MQHHSNNSITPVIITDLDIFWQFVFSVCLQFMELKSKCNWLKKVNLNIMHFICNVKINYIVRKYSKMQHHSSYNSTQAGCWWQVVAALTKVKDLFSINICEIPEVAWFLGKYISLRRVALYKQDFWCLSGMYFQSKVETESWPSNLLSCHIEGLKFRCLL